MSTSRTAIPFPGDPRGTLKRQLARLAKLGYGYHIGPEIEFFLFRREGDQISPLPHDRSGYFDVSTGLASDVRKDMILALTEMGIVVEQAHHEGAVGQHEIDFRYADALRTADQVITFKYTLKAIAQRHGLHATFMPKPMEEWNGSGMHTHLSLYHLDTAARTPSPTPPIRTACRRSRGSSWRGCSTMRAGCRRSSRR